MANETASKYGVLLFEHAWKELGKPLNLISKRVQLESTSTVRI